MDMAVALVVGLECSYMIVYFVKIVYERSQNTCLSFFIATSTPKRNQYGKGFDVLTFCLDGVSDE
jgi:hypothetical protein